MEITSFHFTEVDGQHKKFSSSKVFGKNCCSMLYYSLADDGCSSWSLVRHLNKKIWCRERERKTMLNKFLKYSSELIISSRALWQWGKWCFFLPHKIQLPSLLLVLDDDSYAGAVICCFSFKLKALLLGRRRQRAKWKRKDDIFLFGFPVAAMERKSQHLLNFLSSLSLWRFECFIFFNPLCSAHYSSSRWM